MEASLRHIIDKDWITIVIFTSVVLLAVSKTFFYGRFLDYLILPFNNKYVFMYNKKDRLQSAFHVFFTFFFIINASLFLHYIFKTHFTEVYSAQPFSFAMVMATVVGLLLSKLLIQVVNGFIFNTRKTISEIIFRKLSYLNYSGIAMLIANTVLTYIWVESKIVIYVGILLIILINVVGWVRLIRNHQKFIAANFFYFILYLCALEIAPFIIIGNYLKG